MSKNIYLHTAEGKPAMFDGEQIVTVCTSTGMTPAMSVRQIRNEQQKSIRYRRSHNFEVDPAWYGYRRIVIKES